MDPRSYNFVKAVLGDDGAAALRKAAAKAPTFEHAILPRTVLGWLEVAGEFEYEGEIPGVENTYLAFKKSEAGFAGTIKLSSSNYRFDGASAIHVAAAVAHALGASADAVASSVRDVEIARLGKSIDLLAKAKAATDALNKAHGKDTPGTTAKPIEPTPPAEKVRTQEGQQPPRRVQLPSKPKGLVKKQLRISKSEAGARCTTCSQQQFRGDVFVGCYCMRALAKSVQVTKDATGYVLEFSAAWDREAIVTLTETLKKR